MVNKVDSNQQINRNSNVSKSEFLESALLLLKSMEELVEYASNSIKNNGLKNAALSLEYEKLELLRQLINRYSNNLYSLYSELRKPRYGTGDLITFIGGYNRKLADKLKQSVKESTHESDMLRSLYDLLANNEHRRISLNSSQILTQLELIEDKNRRSAIKKRIQFIRNVSDEIRSLTICLNDVENWNIRTSDLVEHYLSRINLYFEGGMLERINLEGLETRFKDKRLKSRVYEDPDIIRLTRLNEIIYREYEQARFVDSLISLISSDIENGVWVRDVGVKKFYDNIDNYASRFSDDFKNNYFASMLLGNKKQGEQPDFWLRILRNMKAIQETSIARKYPLIVEARKSLYSLLDKRLRELNNFLDILMRKTSELVKNVMEHPEYEDIIQRLIVTARYIEKGILRNIERRKKQFRDKRQELILSNAELFPLLEQAVMKVDIENDTRNFSELVKSLMAFDEHKAKLSSRIKPEAEHVNNLLMLAFDFARLQETLEDVGRIRDRVKRKEEDLTDDEITAIKNRLMASMTQYKSILEIIDSFGLKVNIERYQEHLTNFEINYLRGGTSG